eukprot:TRINITY_DN169903_c0_g1_i1.p1 TRINITY_DN169903_c0_g1~~TRINITY_DN169903_c0_g1_i1.p1  ORF type:complete len:214 (+),score=63.40 TRINITY_DN169903_c0_g1_i1:156-797(+)
MYKFTTFYNGQLHGRVEVHDVESFMHEKSKHSGENAGIFRKDLDNIEVCTVDSLTFSPDISLVVVGDDSLRLVCGEIAHQLQKLLSLLVLKMNRAPLRILFKKSNMESLRDMVQLFGKVIGEPVTNEIEFEKVALSMEGIITELVEAHDSCMEIDLAAYTSEELEVIINMVMDDEEDRIALKALLEVIDTCGFHLCLQQPRKFRKSVEWRQLE